MSFLLGHGAEGWSVAPGGATGPRIESIPITMLDAGSLERDARRGAGEREETRDSGRVARLLAYPLSEVLRRARKSSQDHGKYSQRHRPAEGGSGERGPTQRQFQIPATDATGSSDFHFLTRQGKVKFPQSNPGQCGSGRFEREVGRLRPEGESEVKGAQGA